MSTRLINSIFIVMLLLNLGFAANCLMKYMKRHDRKHQDELVQKRQVGSKLMFLASRLGFDSLQRDKSEKELFVHANTMRKYRQELIRLNNEIFNCINQQIPDTLHAYKFADSIGIWKSLIQKEQLRNSISLKAICNPGQKKEYDELFPLADVESPGNGD